MTRPIIPVLTTKRRWRSLPLPYHDSILSLIPHMRATSGGRRRHIALVFAILVGGDLTFIAARGASAVYGREVYFKEAR
ncbi:MAG: hypothetical protein WCF79_10115 [Rhodomicrobium sp.]